MVNHSQSMKRKADIDASQNSTRYILRTCVCVCVCVCVCLHTESENKEDSSQFVNG